MSRPSESSPADAVDDSLHCERCDYDLRGLTVARCPECGLEFDPAARPKADVPWLRRKESGTLGAYYQTVWRVLFRPQDFAEQVWRVGDINPLESETFARFTVNIATFSAL